MVVITDLPHSVKVIKTGIPEEFISVLKGGKEILKC